MITMNWIFGTWPWYIAGPLIGLFVPALLIGANKMLGISSSFEQICVMVLPKEKKPTFPFDMAKNGWKLYFVIGIGLGGFIAVQFLSSSVVPFLPDKYFTDAGFVKLLIGGFCVGFGTRYANGCTSGHTIFGLSILNPGSLKATIGFFIGGLLSTYIAMLL